MFRRVYGIFGRGLVPSDTHDGTIGQLHYLPLVSITTSTTLTLSLCMLEKTILNVVINIFYLGPSLNGVYWVRDFTIKLYRQVYSDLPDFFQL